MIYKLTPIHFLDINEGVDYNETAEFLFTHYAHKINTTEKGEEIIFASNDNVKITDWKGWTQLEKIEKVIHPDWYELEPRVPSGLSKFTPITVSSDALIPVYDNHKMIRGFHGELKFAYTIKTADKLLYPDKIRFVKLIDPSGVDNPFSGVSIIPKMNSPAIGYNIYTKSKFFNAGIYHLYGSNDMTDGNIFYK